MRCVGFALACVLALGTTIAGAQDMRELRGTVEDRTGGVIVDAVVRADNLAGGRSETVTDGTGRYRLGGLVPGTYLVTISSAGFADFVTRIDLTSRRARILDATLQIAMREEIDVNASDSAGNVTADTFTVSGKDIDALPDDPAALIRRLQELIGTTGGEAAPVRVDGFAAGGRVPPKRPFR